MLKRLQKLTMILETQETNLEWRQVLKDLLKHLETQKVEMKEAHLDLVSEEDHVFEVFNWEKPEESYEGIRKELDAEDQVH